MDRVVYQFSGLQPYNYTSFLPGGTDRRPIADRSFPNGFPPKRIVTPVYMTWENFRAMPKPQEHRAAFVWRDGRDLLVSWYFSALHSHPPTGRIAERRALLKTMSKSDGLAYGIDHLLERGTFQSIHGWRKEAGGSSEVILLAYEDLVGPEASREFRRLFMHFGMEIPENKLQHLLARHSFTRRTKRLPGQEDAGSKLRKAKAGDWSNHFDESVAAVFDEKVAKRFPLCVRG